MNAQNLQSSVESAGQLELLVEDRDHQISADGDPYLSLHRIGAGAVVVLDSQVTLDPAEEQLDAPAQLVKHGHGECRNLEVVGQEGELLACFQIDVFHPSQEHREGLAGFFESRFADMVAAQPRQAIHRFRVMPRELKVRFGTGDKERSSMGNQRQSDEVHVATIHQIERSCFEEETVEPSHVVLARSSNVDAGWNRATQVDLGVHLDSCFRLPEIGPWEKSERKINRGGIQRIDRVVQIDAEILAGIKWPRLAYQALGEILPDAPVPLLVGFGQCRFGNRLGEAEVIESFGPGIEAGGDVAQAIPRGHLGKNHAGELLPESKMTDCGCGFVSSHYAIESLAVDQVENLGENEAAAVHGRKFWKMPIRSSNPSHAIFPVTDSFEMFSKNANSIQPDTRVLEYDSPAIRSHGR